MHTMRVQQQSLGIPNAISFLDWVGLKLKLKCVLSSPCFNRGSRFRGLAPSFFILPKERNNIRKKTWRRMQNGRVQQQGDKRRDAEHVDNRQQPRKSQKPAGIKADNTRSLFEKNHSAPFVAAVAAVAQHKALKPHKPDQAQTQHIQKGASQQP